MKTREQSIYTGELGPSEIVSRTCRDFMVGVDAVTGDGKGSSLTNARVMIAARLVQAGMKYHHVAKVLNKDPRTARYYLAMDKDRERKRRI